MKAPRQQMCTSIICQHQEVIIVTIRLVTATNIQRLNVPSVTQRVSIQHLQVYKVERRQPVVQP